MVDWSLGFHCQLPKAQLTQNRFLLSVLCASAAFALNLMFFIGIICRAGILGNI